MNINTITFVRDLIHATSLAVLVVVAGIVLIGVIKPKYLKFVLSEFADRKYILIGGVFISLLCGTVYTATQSTYTSYESSNPNQLAQQTKENLPETKQPTQQVQGASTDSSAPITKSPSSPPASATPVPSETKSTPAPVSAPTPGTQPQVDAPGESRTTTPSPQPTNDKKCERLNVLFVCL